MNHIRRQGHLHRYPKGLPEAKANKLARLMGSPGCRTGNGGPSVSLGNKVEQVLGRVVP